MPSTSTCLQIEDYIKLRGLYSRVRSAYIPRRLRLLTTFSKSNLNFKLSFDTSHPERCVDLEVQCNVIL